MDMYSILFVVMWILTLALCVMIGVAMGQSMAMAQIMGGVAQIKGLITSLIKGGADNEQ